MKVLYAFPATLGLRTSIMLDGRSWSGLNGHIGEGLWRASKLSRIHHKPITLNSTFIKLSLSNLFSETYINIERVSTTNQQWPRTTESPTFLPEISTHCPRLFMLSISLIFLFRTFAQNHTAAPLYADLIAKPTPHPRINISTCSNRRPRGTMSQLILCSLMLRRSR